MFKNQKTLLSEARARQAALCRIFNEIQTGPNPMTPAEVRQIIDKRPDVYGFLEKFASARKVNRH